MGESWPGKVRKASTVGQYLVPMTLRVRKIHSGQVIEIHVGNRNKKDICDTKLRIILSFLCTCLHGWHSRRLVSEHRVGYSAPKMSLSDVVAHLSCVRRITAMTTLSLHQT